MWEVLVQIESYLSGAFLEAQTVKSLPPMQEPHAWSLGQKDPLEKGRVTHSSFLPWEFHGERNWVDNSPWGCRVTHDWMMNTFPFTLVLNKCNMCLPFIVTVGVIVVVFLSLMQPVYKSVAAWQITDKLSDFKQCQFYLVHSCVDQKSQ